MFSSPTVLHEDNQGALVWGTDGVQRAKRISLKRNFVKDHVAFGTVSLKYCPTEFMFAEVLTKPPLRVRFEVLRTAIGVLDMPFGANSKKGW